jgi:hypothetical protein
MTLPSFPNVDLLSAGINALNGVLVARNPSHSRGYTVAALLIMASVKPPSVSPTVLHLGASRS